MRQAHAGMISKRQRKPIKVARMAPIRLEEARSPHANDKKKKKKKKKQKKAPKMPPIRLGEKRSPHAKLTFFRNECSTIKTILLLDCPPTENPCRKRQRIKARLVTIPISSYVGSTPIKKVGKDVNMIDKFIVYFLPYLSPK